MSSTKSSKRDSSDKKKKSSSKKKDKKVKSRKTKKDPNAPKRPMTAYILFSNAKREEVKAAHPGIKFIDIPKRISEMWKAIGAKERQKYDLAAKEAKDKYEEAKAEYDARHDSDVKSSKSSKKSKKSKHEEEEEEDDDDDDDEDDDDDNDDDEDD